MGKLNKRTLIQWANRKFDVMELLEQVGVSKPRPGSMCYCPFHEDTNKMSAKIFKDALHCFAEAKQYRPYDILRFMSISDDQIEDALKATGPVPLDLNLDDSEIRIPVVNSLGPVKMKFIEGSLDIEAYSAHIHTSFINKFKESHA